MGASASPLGDAGAAGARVLDGTPVLPAEHVHVGEAVGRVLAEDMRAPAELPAFPSSAVDGFAMRAAEGGATLRIAGESAAGRPFAGGLQPGTPARILTAALLPRR